MSDEKIEVEWIGTANKMLAVLDKVENKLTRQDAVLARIEKSSVKAGDSAVGSFNRLEQELKENEKQLKALTIGTAEFEAQRKKVDALRASLQSAKGELAKGGGVISNALSSGVAKITQLAAGMASLQQIVTAVVSELDKAKQLSIAAATANRTVEAAIADMAVNIGAENVAPARQLIEQNAPQLGVTQEGLANLLASGISGGAENISEALDLASKTLALTAGDAQKAGPLMSGMLTLAKTTGNRDFESVLGQLSQFQAAGRGEDFAMSINNMSTAIAAANVKGERIAALGAERTLELGAAISQLIQDPTMAVTGTTMRQMIQKMDTFVPKQKATLDDGTKSTLPKDAIDAFNKLGTLDERMMAMRQNPELAKQFLSTIEQNQGKSAIAQLVKGTEQAVSTLAAAEKIVTPAEGGKLEYQKLADAIGAQTATVKAQNVSQANIQSRQTSGTTGLEGQAMQIVEDTLNSVNLSGIDYFRTTEVSADREIRKAQGQSEFDIAIEALTRLQQQQTLTGPGGLVPVGMAPAEKDVALMQSQIEVIKQLKAAAEVRDRMAIAPAAPNVTTNTSVEPIVSVPSAAPPIVNATATAPAVSVNVPGQPAAPPVNPNADMKASLDRLVSLQAENNAILKGKPTTSPSPVIVRTQAASSPAPATRPREAPLPAATVP